MKSELWAKFTTPMRPKMRVSPVATSTRFTPTVRPMSPCVRRASSDIASELAGPVVRVGDALQHVDHHAPHGVRLHLAHVDVLDRVVRLGIEAQRAARAVDLHGLDDLHEL